MQLLESVRAGHLQTPEMCKDTLLDASLLLESPRELVQRSWESAIRQFLPNLAHVQTHSTTQDDPSTAHKQVDFNLFALAQHAESLSFAWFTPEFTSVLLQRLDHHCTSLPHLASTSLSESPVDVSSSGWDLEPGIALAATLSLLSRFTATNPRAASSAAIYRVLVYTANHLDPETSPGNVLIPLAATYYIQLLVHITQSGWDLPPAVERVFTWLLAAHGEAYRYTPTSNTQPSAVPPRHVVSGKVARSRVCGPAVW